jgi:6-phosphofructo-2-kinase/fructose-2,6-biphosphatase
VFPLSLCTWKNTEKLELKFILKAKPGNRANLIATEEGTNRVLHTGSMAAGEAGPDAQFKLLLLEEEEEYTASLLLTLLISVEVDPVSPFALAASWQVVKKNIQSHGSTVLGIPDVCMGKLQHRRCASEAQISSSSSCYALELDLQHYEVPTPTSNMSAVGIKYSANGAEDPSKSLLDQTSSGADIANF